MCTIMIAIYFLFGIYLTELEQLRKMKFTVRKNL